MKGALHVVKGILGAISVIALLAGCAHSGSSEHGGVVGGPAPGLDNAPAKVRLKSFSRVELKGVSLTPGNKQRDVDELARRVDLSLQMNLAPLWPKVTLVPRDVPFTTTPAGTLQIEPVIVESKLVDSFEREIFTWGMGDALVVIKVLFKDGATGEAVAEPVFLRRSSLFWASWSAGFTDREIEREITRDICNYARDNF